MRFSTRQVPVAATTIAVLATMTYAAVRPAGMTASAATPHRVAASHTRSLTPVHFDLNWLPNVEFAGLWVAQQKGWWKKAGIQMSYTGWSTGKSPEIDVPNQGGNTFGFQSGAALAIARSKGVPDVALYTDTQRSVFGLTVMANSSIHTLKDLRGKRVGYQSDEFYVPATMLAYAGLRPTDWRPVQVGFDPTELTSGHVDAYLTFITNEPIALAMQGVKTRSFRAADYGFHFYDDVMFTTDSLVKSNPALVRKVVDVAARGFAWAHTHPAAAARITVAKYFTAPKGNKAKLNLEQQIRELQTFKQFSRDSHGRYSGLMTASYWRDSVNILYRYKQISSKPNVSQLFTNRFNPNH